MRCWLSKRPLSSLWCCGGLLIWAKAVIAVGEVAAAATVGTVIFCCAKSVLSARPLLPSTSNFTTMASSLGTEFQLDGSSSGTSFMSSDNQKVLEEVCTVDLLSSGEVRDRVETVEEDHKKRLPQEVAEGLPMSAASKTFQRFGELIYGGAILMKFYIYMERKERFIERRVTEFAMNEVYTPVAGDTDMDLGCIHELQKDVTRRDV
ncbi:hypothetical protein R1sor_019447 [Riccia sorocarpa]|uniref:Uncharacterized protein n=1 Tax=Riccia sorocarpa TaxID=122646 RepID=A0ABD3IG64_9MARC